MKQNTTESSGSHKLTKNDQGIYREALVAIRDILKQKALYDDETARFLAHKSAQNALGIESITYPITIRTVGDLLAIADAFTDVFEFCEATNDADSPQNIHEALDKALKEFISEE